MGPLIICKTLQVIFRILWGHWACLGVQWGRRGPQGFEGVNRYVEGIPWRHGVRLMSFLMIHKAYMPAYKWSRAWWQTTKQPTDPRTCLTWPVTNLTLITFFQFFILASPLWAKIENALKNKRCLGRSVVPLAMFLPRGMQEAALYERQWMHCKVFVLCVHVLFIKRHARGCFIWGGHCKHSGSGGLPAWGHFYGGALCVDTSMGHCWPIPTDFWPPSILSYHVEEEDICLRGTKTKKQNLVLHCTVHLIKPITLLLVRHICRKYGQNRSKLDKIGQHFYAKKYTAF